MERRQGQEPNQVNGMSKSDKLLLGSVCAALVLGPISPTAGGVATAVGIGTGAFKVGRIAYRRFVHRERAR